MSILKLKEVHAQTHPARLTRTGAARLDALAAEPAVPLIEQPETAAI